MYKINDRVSAIKEIQSYLMEIYPQRNISPNGIYDSKTSDAVKEFQADNKIQASGVVDYETHLRLYSEYVRRMTVRKVNETEGAFIAFPISYGNYSEYVASVNIIMSNILDSYGVYHAIRRGRYFSQESADAVRILRQILMLEDGEDIDELLYDKLLEMHRMIYRMPNDF